RTGALEKRARDQGTVDAASTGSMLHKDEFDNSREENRGADTWHAYLEGFNAANKDRAALWGRAYELGSADGRRGEKEHQDDIFKWPEIQKLTQGNLAMTQVLNGQLAQHYSDGYDISTGKKTGLEDD